MICLFKSKTVIIIKNIMKTYNISLDDPFLLTLVKNIPYIVNSTNLKKTIFLLPTKVAKIDFSSIFFDTYGFYPKVFVLNESIQDDTPEHFLFCTVFTILRKEIQATPLKNAPTKTLISLSHMLISAMMEVIGHLENTNILNLPTSSLKNDSLSQTYAHLFEKIYNEILKIKEEKGLVFSIEKRIKHIEKLKSFLEKLPENYDLIVAGIIATRPFVKSFLSDLQNFNLKSSIVVSGDNLLTQEFPTGHPCHLTQKLLIFLNIKNIEQIKGNSLSNIQILKCSTQEQEAREIAQKISIFQDKKIAFITQNNLLRTMVEEELLQLGINIQQYKTKFLNQTPTGKLLEFANHLLFKPFCIHTAFGFLKHIKTHCHEFELNLRKQNLPISTLLQKEQLPHMQDITSFLHTNINKAQKKPYTFYQNKLKEFLLSKANFCDDTLGIWDSLKNLPPLSSFEFASVFQDLLNKTSMPPTLKNPYLIFSGSPLDARLRMCELIILGDLTDGSWPKTKLNPWVSDHHNIPTNLEYQGLSFLDFKQLIASSPSCIITYCQVKDGKAQTPSPFLQNMHNKIQKNSEKHLNSKGNLNLNYKPKSTLKPLKMNASDIKRLISNPYLFYMRKILKIEPLPILSNDISASLLGQIVHKAFENKLKNKPFNISSFSKLPAYQEKQLEKLIENFMHTIKKIENSSFFPEKKEIILIQGIQVSSRIDLVIKHQNNIHIIDYKTSTPPSIKSVLEWETPQLSIEALCIKNTKLLEYWHAPIATGSIKKTSIPVTQEWMDQTLAFFENLFLMYKDDNYIFEKTENYFDTDEQHFMHIEF